MDFFLVLIYHQIWNSNKKKVKAMIYVRCRKKDVGNHGNSQDIRSAASKKFGLFVFISVKTKFDSFPCSGNTFFFFFFSFLFFFLSIEQPKTKPLWELRCVFRWIASCFDLWKPKKKSIPRCTTKQFVFFCFWFDPDVTSSTVIVGAPEEEETAEGGGVALGLPASSGYCQ